MTERASAALGVHVAATRWLDFRASMGPNWMIQDGGAPVLGGRFGVVGGLHW